MSRSVFKLLPCVLLLVAIWPAGQSSLAGEILTQQAEVASSQIRGVVEEEDTDAIDPAEVLSKGPKTKWIWESPNGKKNEVVYLTKTFMGGSPEAAFVVATCDNGMEVRLNGKKILSSREWNAPVSSEITTQIKAGENRLEVRGTNAGGVAAFALKLVLVKDGKSPEYIISDESWQAAPGEGGENTHPAVVVATMGANPWGDVFASSSYGNTGGTPRGVFEVLPGFQVEKLFDVPAEQLGSWVCMTTDDQGRLLVSDQGDKGLCRITPAPLGSDEPTKVEKLDVAMTSCQGMLYAFGKLYCSVNGGPGSGFYAVEDTDGDDQYDQVTKLKAFEGGGEHGPHAIRLSPDGESLYVIAGNHTNPPSDFDASRLPSNWSEDLLLPRRWDARGHARGKLAPGGWIAKTDPEGKTWEIVSSGFRNPYDMAFNSVGELFAYDADMEYDMGSPWYRPTRVVHAVSGSEFGWRSGTGKWPTYYEDSIPPVVDIGPGSPVGVTFGYGTDFPPQYQEALYILDWTFGTIYAVHLSPEGSTYTGKKEEFLSRTPLPLTDAVVGNEGALYFTIGGRGTESALFRVTYVGKEPAQSDAPTSAAYINSERLREIRVQLEKMHQPGDVSEQQYSLIWKSLDIPDRFLRYAARVALENRPVDEWRVEAFQSDRPWRVIEASIALSRQGNAADQEHILSALNKLNFAELNQQQRMAYLRAYSLAFIRLGEPSQKTAASLAESLDPFYPADHDDLNRELSRMLVYLQSPQVITKTLKLMNQPYERSSEEISELLKRNPGYGRTIVQMLDNQPEIQNIHYAFVLRNMKYGWTLEQRREYVQWLEKAKQWSGGASYIGFLDFMKEDSLASASEAERKAIESTVVEYTPPALADLPKAAGPGRDWTVEGLLAEVKGSLEGRDYENGRKIYAAAQCIRCHRFQGDGGATGPDLTNVAGRFSFRDLSEALIEPSKVISDQYKASMIITVDGKVISGRILNEENGQLTVMTDPVDATKVVTINAEDVEEISPAKASLMPNDLLDTLNAEEALDLLAYLYSRGNPADRMFQKKE